MATVKPTDKAEMLAAFLVAPPTISGEPTIGELVRILQHLMACAQSHQSDISRLNLLYVCIPAQLYHHYNETNEPYPTDPVDPGPMPVYAPGDDAAAHCNIRAQWEYAHKRYNDVNTMNNNKSDPPGQCTSALIHVYPKCTMSWGGLELKQQRDIAYCFVAVGPYRQKSKMEICNGLQSGPKL